MSVETAEFVVAVAVGSCLGLIAAYLNLLWQIRKIKRRYRERDTGS